MTTKSDTADVKAAILAGLDIQAEYEAMGVRIAKGARENAQGWLPCHSVLRPDKRPSAGINVGDGPHRGFYVDFGEAGHNGKPQLSKSLFDAAIEWADGPAADFRKALQI